MIETPSRLPVKLHVVAKVGRLFIGLHRRIRQHYVVNPIQGVMLPSFDTVEQAKRKARRVDVKWRHRTAQRKARRATRLAHG